VDLVDYLCGEEVSLVNHPDGEGNFRKPNDQLLNLLKEFAMQPVIGSRHLSSVKNANM
jgi:hypothetical protein